MKNELVKLVKTEKLPKSFPTKISSVSKNLKHNDISLKGKNILLYLKYVIKYIEHTREINKLKKEHDQKMFQLNMEAEIRHKEIDKKFILKNKILDIIEKNVENITPEMLEQYVKIYINS
ncbi:MAG: hypothetical protein Q9M37_02575 [Desulfonauticus sp.]|nr:hypothetical protein [Desulfonauticus sp.]